MTPEEFRSRAGTAVEPIEPSTASYAWLRENVARRRRRAYVTWSVAATATLAIVVGAFLAVPHREAAPPARTPDGAPVRVTAAAIVESEPTKYSYWHWGVRVTLSPGREQTVWFELDLARIRGVLEIAAIADLDLDGRDEVVVRMYQSVGSFGYVILTTASGTAQWVAGPDSILYAGTVQGWGCADLDTAHPGLELYTVSAHVGLPVTRHVYRLDGSELREIDVRQDRVWSRARIGKVACGAIVIPYAPE